MKCVNCGTENPEGKPYCHDCGHTLVLPCAHCGAGILPSNRYCGECGNPIEEISGAGFEKSPLEDKLKQIQRYLPSGLVEKILANRDKIEGERKLVTIMFCDIKGFTPLTEQIGAEGTFSLINRIYEILIHKVHEYGGTVNEFRGDGILALFGAPIAVEDAPQRALRSALAIQGELARFNEKAAADRNVPPILMRIGINTGPVVVGSVGNDLRVQFTAVGDTINLASRMESIAAPGTTYVTEETFKSTQGLFRFEFVGEKRIKGRTALEKVYRLISSSSHRTRFDVSAESGLTPFIGRDKELGVLLDCFAHTKKGRGQTVFMVSEAGVGKSRLLYEFRKAVAGEDVTFLEGRCFSYSRGVPFYPLIDILKSGFGIREGDDDAGIRRKVKQGLRLSGVDESSTLPYVLELLSVKDSGLDQISMSIESRRHRIVEALSRILLSGADKRPLIIAFEDLHWIDRSSQDILGSILEIVPQAKILSIFTSRPEFSNPWEAEPYCRQMVLGPLSDADSLGMAVELLKTDAIEKELEQLILEKAEGVPFFLEEFIRSLLDLEIIQPRANTYAIAHRHRALRIPSTIQGVLTARIDSLPERTRQLLRIASCIEREFSYRLIRRLSDLSEDTLISELSALKNARFLYERGIHPDSTYVFKHALAWETVYDSLLEKNKQRLHGKIAHAMEDLFKDRIDEQYGTLAAHFIAGGNHRKGAEYSRLAAVKAEKIGALNDAVNHAARRVNTLDAIASADIIRKEVTDARVALGFYLFQMGHFLQAQQAIEPILDTIEQGPATRERCLAYVMVGCYHYAVNEDHTRAIDYLEKAQTISEQVGDLVSFGFSTYFLGMVLSFNCEFEKAFGYFEKLLEASVAIESSWRVSAMKSNMSVYAYNYQGRVDKGFQTSLEATHIAEESGDVLSKAMAYTNHGTSCYYKGYLNEAESWLLRAVYLNDKTGLMLHSALAHQWLGHTYSDLGRYAQAIDHYQKTIEIRERSGLFPSSANLNRIARTRARVLNGETGIDLEKLLGRGRENRLRLYTGWVARLICETLLHTDRPHHGAAEEWIKRAITADKQNGMTWDLGRDFRLYGALEGHRNNHPKARRWLEKACAVAEECGADGWLTKWKAALSEHA